MSRSGASFTKEEGFWRDGRWLTRERIVTYSALAVAGYAAVVLASACGWLDLGDRPLGLDFRVFWAAGSLALGGAAAAAYDPHEAARHALPIGEVLAANHPWLYPPLFFLIVAPLALLPYGWALALWSVSTAAAYVAGIRRIVARPAAVLVALAWPAFFVNLRLGQNGCLSAALLAAGVLALDARPVLAGVLFGALCFKPQVALLVPAALLAGRHWRALGAMGFTVLAAAAATVVLFGPDAWPAFKSASGLMGGLNEPAAVGYGRVTVFSSLRLLGAGVGPALWLQGAVSISVLALVMASWRLPRPTHLKGAVLAAAIPLATPHALPYDLVTAAVAAAWLARDGLRAGFLPWERTVLAVTCVAPAASLPLAYAFGLQLAPLAELALVVACVRRLRHPESDLKAPGPVPI